MKAHSETGAVCPQHGTPVQRSTIQTLGVALSFDSGCHSCEREAAEKERREEQRGFEHAQAVAAIPARYRTASLASFPALAPGQDFVLHHAHAFIETSGSGSTGLILLGSLGTGKTHIACAILNAFLRRGLSGRYMTTTQAIRLVTETRQFKSQKTEQQVLSELWAPHLLVLDEVSLQDGGDREFRILTEIVSGRYDRRRPTILIDNVTVKEFTHLVGERIVDRFREGGKVLPFDWPSLRHE